MVHAVLFLCAAWLFTPLVADAPRRTRLIVYALALIMFGDVMYAAYLNSFYMDVAAYLFALLAAILYLRTVRWRRTSDTVLLAIGCVLLTTSKAQHAALGLWAAVLLYWCGKRGARSAIFAACLAALAGSWIVKSTPPEYSLRGCFTMVFYQVLPHAKNVDRTLADLHLDDSYRRYIGMHSFSDGSPMDDPRFVEAFRRRISYARLACFFLTHPRDAYVALRHSLDGAGRQRPLLGNFDVNAGLPPFAESRSFALWSDLKRRLFEGRGSRFFFCLLGLAAALALILFLERGRIARGELWAGYALIGMTGTELAISSLADSLDIPRHHLLFYLHFDLLVIAAAYLALRRWADPACFRAQSRA
jgi:hypothetical protein